MRVVLNRFPEPPDVVLAGLQPIVGDWPGFPFAPDAITWPEPVSVMQGDQPVAAMKGDPVPRALVGWNPYFAQPATAGPLPVASGEVLQIPIGPAAPVRPLIDPIQIFINSALPLDSNGDWFPAPDEAVLAAYPEPLVDRLLGAETDLALPTPIGNPPREIAESGLLKRFAVARMPAEFGLTTLPLYSPTLASQVFTLTGVTLTGAGAPEGNVRVLLMQSGWRNVPSGEKIIAETVSDGSGNFSFLCRNIDYQLVGNKSGAPDLAGITRETVVPTALLTSIYMRDPTALDSVGGGSGMSRARVVNKGT